MASIQSIQTALPKYHYTTANVLQEAKKWLEHDQEKQALFIRLLSASTIQQRYFSIPLEQFLTLDGLKYRSTVFEEVAPVLGVEAASQVLADTGTVKSLITCSLFTSCTCPTIPAVDTTIIERLGLSPNIMRIPIYQHGCAGGIIGLGLGNRLAEQGETVLLTSVELCSLGFQPKNTNPEQLVGATLFGDGAASVLISPNEQKGLVFVDTLSHLIPGTRHLMGYDILDDGMHLRLDRELPRALAETVPDLVHSFLGQHSLTVKDVPWWLFHPGGIKILSYLEQAFVLHEQQCRFAREVLHNVGNLSSATILFVVKQFIDAKVSKPGDYVIAVGVGPGLTIELILFRQA